MVGLRLRVDTHQVLEQFPRCEAAGIRLSTSKSEIMVPYFEKGGLVSLDCEAVSA